MMHKLSTKWRNYVLCREKIKYNTLPQAYQFNFKFKDYFMYEISYISKHWFMT